MPRIVNAVARVRVDFYIDAHNLREAEKMIDAWLIPQEDDERLKGYEVTTTGWVPEDEAPSVSA